MELTPTSYIVLGLVEQLGEASPYDLKQAVASSVGNFWSVPHSQIYREAARLERAGHLSCRHERTSGGRPRKAYRLRPSGARALARWRQEPPKELPDLRDPGLLKLFFGADPCPLAEARRDAHARKLEEYEERRSLDPGDGPRAVWLSLDAGIGHEREWVRFWSEVARERQP
ncbi:MAG: PadR family transcriptional regulator [Actinobacteria bacterium]|nr:PadR family transcriptional regulator [Actinomycetota bacterium]